MWAIDLHSDSWLASGSVDGVVRLYDLHQSAPVRSFYGHSLDVDVRVASSFYFYFYYFLVFLFCPKKEGINYKV